MDRRDPDYDPVIQYRAFRCDCCDSPIYEGDDYYEIAGEWLCESCAKQYFKDCRRTAERVGA